MPFWQWEVVLGHDMALELSKQAYELCRDRDAPGLRAFLEAHPEVDVFLHEDGDGYNIVGVAAGNEDTACMQVLLDFGADVNQQDSVGYTGLHVACLAGHVDCARLLIDSKADVHLQDADGRTGLTVAAWQGKLECLKFMIDAGADVNHQNTKGYSGLHSVCRDGHLDCARLLIESKADVHLQTNQGQTGLILAAWGGAIRVLEADNRCRGRCDLSEKQRLHWPSYGV
jgi:ankyrin repeat protein